MKIDKKYLQTLLLLLFLMHKTLRPRVPPSELSKILLSSCYRAMPIRVHCNVYLFIFYYSLERRQTINAITYYITCVQ